MSYDATLQAIMDVIAGHAMDAGEKRARFAAIWETLGEAPMPLHRCILAHYMADVQATAEDALSWDQRALDAVGAIDKDEFAATLPGLALEGFLPSLHLNLAQDYDRLARPTDARRHIAMAQQSLADLADDGYGQMIRNGVARLETKLGA